MRILPISNPEDLSEVAQTILRNAMLDEEKAKLIEQALKDKRADRRTLFAIAFCMGATQAIHEMMQGHVVEIGNATAARQSKS